MNVTCFGSPPSLSDFTLRHSARVSMNNAFPFKLPEIMTIYTLVGREPTVLIMKSFLSNLLL